MAALGAIDHPRTFRRERRLAFAPAFGLAATAALAAMALLLIGRRAVGALTVPPGAAAALLCSLTVLCLDFAARSALLRFHRGYDLELPWALLLAVTFEPPARGGSVAAIAAALTLPGTSAAAMVLLWLPTATLLVRAGYDRLPRPTNDDDFRRPGEAAATPTLATPERATGSARRLRQQTSRFVDAAGREVIEGTAVALFAAGQRTASIHLAFCPPFERSPEVACGIASAAAADVKAAQVLPYAVRFDVKLATAAAGATEISVSFSARCDLET